MKLGDGQVVKSVIAVPDQDEYAVPPETSVFVGVDLVAADTLELSTEDFKSLLKVTDSRSGISEQRLVVSVSPDDDEIDADHSPVKETVTPDEKQLILEPAPSLIRESSVETSSGLTVRGCMPIAGSQLRYKLDLGEREFGSGVVEWEITIENTRNRNVEFELLLIEGDENNRRLELSKSQSILAAHTFDPVVLQVSTDFLGTFMAYLVLIESKSGLIESKSGLIESKSGHMKLIRIDMQVMAAFNLFDLPREVPPVNSIFSLWVSGMLVTQDSDPVLDLGTVVHGYCYTTSPILVKNESSIPLSFTLSHSFSVPETIMFSIDSFLFVDTHKLTIQPYSQSRVYIWFLPYQVNLVKANIAVACQNIKDHMLSFPITAHCVPRVFTFRKKKHAHHQQEKKNINLNISSLNFSPTKTKHILEISNSHVEESVFLQLAKICACFKMTIGGSTSSMYEIAPGESVELCIFVDPESKMSDRTIVDHLLLVNRSAIHERHHILLYYRIDHMQMFNSAVLDTRKFQVEEQIMQFFNRLMPDKLNSEQIFDAQFDFLVLADLIVFFMSNSFSGHLFYKRAVLFFYIVFERKIIQGSLYTSELARLLSHVPLHEPHLNTLYALKNST